MPHAQRAEQLACAVITELQGAHIECAWAVFCQFRQALANHVGVCMAPVQAQGDMGVIRVLPHFTAVSAQQLAPDLQLTRWVADRQEGRAGKAVWLADQQPQRWAWLAAEGVELLLLLALAEIVSMAAVAADETADEQGDMSLAATWWVQQVSQLLLQPGYVPEQVGALHG